MEVNPYQSPHVEPERRKRADTSSSESFWTGVVILSALAVAAIVSIITGINRRLLFVTSALLIVIALLVWQRITRHA